MNITEWEKHDSGHAVFMRIDSRNRLYFLHFKCWSTNNVDCVTYHLWKLWEVFMFCAILPYSVDVVNLPPASQVRLSMLRIATNVRCYILLDTRN